MNLKTFSEFIFVYTCKRQKNYYLGVNISFVFLIDREEEFQSKEKEFKQEKEQMEQQQLREKTQLQAKVRLEM